MIFANNPVIAHRGAWKAKGFPQNSIASLKQAIALGCRGSEFDVWMTADDYLVVHHDKHFHKLLIEKTSYTNLTKFTLTNGKTLPTLTEYILAGIKNNSQTQLICEIKPTNLGETRAEQIVKKILLTVVELNAEKFMTYISFDFSILKTIKQLNPEALTQYLNGDRSPEEVKLADLAGMNYHFKVFEENPNWIKEAKELGLTLNTWTVNTPKRMDFLLANDFDFITTNEPEMLLERYKSSVTSNTK